MADPNTVAAVPVVAVAAPAASAPTPEPERQLQAATAQPRMEAPTAGEQNRRKAIRILLAKGHRETAHVVAEGPRPEDRPALEAAFQDQAVPGGIRYNVIRPLLNRLDEQKATLKLTNLLREIGEACRLLDSDPGARGAFGAKAALLRAGRIRFEGREMAALEWMLERSSLPSYTPATAVEVALHAPRGTRARALLIALTDTLWVKVRKIIP